MDKKQICEHLNMIMEGKIWDKVKKVWRDHKGKIIIGGALAASALAKIALKKKQHNDDQKTANANSVNLKCPPGVGAHFSAGKFMGCGPAGALAAKKNAEKLLGKKSIKNKG